LILFLNLKNLIFFLIKSSKNYKINLKNHRFLNKKLRKLSIKNKIKKSPSLDFFCFNFCDNLKTFVVVSFLTPLDSRNLTTVKFLESALPQGENDSPRTSRRLHKNCRADKPSKGEGLRA
jgi:hypothetical protein